MAIRRGIAELFEAIPERIEVSGISPTWEVTGGSFDSVVSYVQDAFDDPVVLRRRDRNRWWPRVTLTVTTDPHLAATAPPLESLFDPEPEAADLDDLEAAMAPDPNRDSEWDPEWDPEEPVEQRLFAEDEHFESFLEEIFARQERQRAQRGRIPEQRRRRA
jgi:hypothetical protein